MTPRPEATRSSLAQRLVRLARIAGIVPVAVLLALTLVLAWRLDYRLTDFLERDYRDRLAGVTDGVIGMLKSQHESLQQILLSNLNVAEDLVRRRGGLGLSGGSVVWNARNQLSGEVRSVSLPGMTLGGAWLGQNRDPKVATQLVDETARLVGGTVTLFQRMSPGGDMLRVATNVVTKEGQRAIGTYIPAQNPDGSPNPVVASILANKRYEGRAFVVDSWYQTVYQPISDGAGRVIGMIYVGVKQENVPSLRRSILAARVGATGRVIVLGGSGAQKGRFIISADQKADGTDALKLVDRDSVAVYQAMIDSALASKNGSVSLHRFRSPVAGQEDQARIAGVSYFAPWDWVVIAEAPASEFSVALDTTRATILQLIVALIITGGLIAWGTLAYMRRSARAITEPVQHLAEAAERLAQGDLTLEVTAQGDQEIAGLGISMQRIVEAERGLASAAQSLAQGNLAVTLTSRGEHDTLGQAMIAIHLAEKNVVSAASRIAAGDLAREVPLRSSDDGLSGAMNAIIRTERELSAALDKVASGDLQVTVAPRSAQDDLSRAVARIVAAEHTLAEAAGRIAAGDLSVEVAPRSERDQLSLAFRQILEAERRLAEAATRIAAGDVSVPFATRGPQDALGQAFTRLQGTIQGLSQETHRLIDAASAGSLGVRGDTRQFAGDFHALVQGINQLLDASSGPLQEAAGVLGAVAGNDLTLRMKGSYQGDHAAFASDVNRMTEDLSGSMSRIGDTASQLAGAAADLRNAGETVKDSASLASAEAGSVAEHSQQVAATVASVAAGAEEMSASIREIARNATSAATVASNAVTAAAQADKQVARLGDSSQQIGEIVRTISQIAQQTNLLALNATIEAARAGEAGKGFAVVANEVKDLAGNTARATAEISRRVEAIQGDATGAVEALNRIRGIIDEISSLQTAIAGAVEEQTATTSEMSRGIAGAADGVGRIASGIESVAAATGRSSEAITRSQAAIEGLAGMAAELRALVGRFRYTESAPAVPASRFEPVRR